MKKYLKILPFAAFFLAFSAHAEVLLKDSSEIIGVWDLHDEAISLTAPKKHTDVEWDIRPDGTIQTTSSDKHLRVKNMKITIKYHVEDGVLKKQAAVGREKYETCKVVEKDSKDMVLHCAYFFFLTKK